MRTRLVAWLERVVTWLQRGDPVQLAARVMVDRADGLGVARGEYKRHWAHARLIRQFPDVPKRDLSMAIERAVQRRG